MDIGPLLERSVKEEMAKKPAPNWRIRRTNFVRKTARRICEPGSVTFSAGWFGQGHAVRHQFSFVISLTGKQNEDYLLKPSLNL
jgi:hypothetical protein